MMKEVNCNIWSTVSLKSFCCYTLGNQSNVLKELQSSVDKNTRQIRMLRVEVGVMTQMLKEVVSNQHKIIESGEKNSAVSSQREAPEVFY